MTNNIDLTNRTKYLTLLAEKFHMYLQCISTAMSDDVLFDGTNEGRNKILSNIDVALKKLSGLKHIKYLITDYYSEEAYEKIKNNDFKHLVYEHIMPKNIYQNKIFNDLRNNKVPTKEELFDILNKYWILATINEDQDMLHINLRGRVPIELSDIKKGIKLGKSLIVERTRNNQKIKRI